MSAALALGWSTALAVERRGKYGFRSFGRVDGDGGLSQPFPVLLILPESNYNIAQELIEKKPYFLIAKLDFISVLYQFLEV